jgi:hypothetical protein
MSPQEINVFTYVDLDLADSSSDHTATLLQANNWMEVLGNDKGPTIGEIRGIGADRYAVTTHSDLRDELNGPEPITLGNTGLPYGPGDFTGGLQWQNRTLPANGSLQFQWVISVDESALLGDRLFADEFDCSWFESCPGQVFTNLPALEEDDATTGLSDVRRKAVMFYTEYYEATTIDQLVLRLQDYDLTGEVVASLKAFDVDNMQAPGELLVSFTPSCCSRTPCTGWKSVVSRVAASTGWHRPRRATRRCRISGMPPPPPMASTGRMISRSSTISD